MDTLRYIVKRILLALLILFGVSIIIYGLSRMMPTDYVDNQYSTAVTQGKMTQEDVDRIKEIYGLYMPDAYLTLEPEEGHEYGGKDFTKNTKKTYYDKVEANEMSRVSWYSGSFSCGEYRIRLDTKTVETDDDTAIEPTTYRLVKVVSEGVQVVEGENEEENDGVLKVEEKEYPVESGTYSINEDGSILISVDTRYEYDGDEVTTVSVNESYSLTVSYRAASFWDKAGTILSGYFVWLGNLLRGDMGVSFKYLQPVGDVIVQNMGISFGIAFVATILQFLIAIPLGIKAATHQYGVVDYTVTILTMIGISLPTFFLAAIMIRVFSVGLGIFPVNGLVSPGLAEGTTGIVVFGDMLWHMVLPMFVLVILSVGSLMRYTRTNTLEVLNADYIRTARAKGLSEKSVIYKHAFRNTMIPLVTLMAGILPSLFGGAMITETVFAIPGIGKLAYDALLVADVPFIMGYNMFLAIMTVIGTLLSDIMYAVVDPRVKLGK